MIWINSVFVENSQNYTFDSFEMSKKVISLSLFSTHHAFLHKWLNSFFINFAINGFHKRGGGQFKLLISKSKERRSELNILVKTINFSSIVRITKNKSKKETNLRIKWLQNRSHQ